MGGKAIGHLEAYYNPRDVLQMEFSRIFHKAIGSFGRFAMPRKQHCELAPYVSHPDPRRDMPSYISADTRVELRPYRASFSISRDELLRHSCSAEDWLACLRLCYPYTFRAGKFYTSVASRRGSGSIDGIR